VLLWVVNRSKDQRSFDIEITGERVGPSLFYSFLENNWLLLKKLKRPYKIQGWLVVDFEHGLLAPKTFPLICCCFLLLQTPKQRLPREFSEI
jgi:hypothetical protein